MVVLQRRNYPERNDCLAGMDSSVYHSGLVSLMLSSRAFLMANAVSIDARPLSSPQTYLLCTYVNLRNPFWLIAALKATKERRNELSSSFSSLVSRTLRAGRNLATCDDGHLAAICCMTALDQGSHHEVDPRPWKVGRFFLTRHGAV